MNQMDEEDTSRQTRRRSSLKDKGLTRRTWTVREEEVLINDLRSLVASGWKCDNGFRTGYLAQVEAFMLRAIPNCDLRAEPHITSKIQVWKRQYSSIVGMMSKSRFGWDESTCMVMIEENSKDVWDNYVKVQFLFTRYNPIMFFEQVAMRIIEIKYTEIYFATNACFRIGKLDLHTKTMRYKSWPFFPAWREIFGKDRAAGDEANDSDGAAAEIRQERNKATDNCYIPMAEWNPNIGFVGVEEEPPLSSQMNVDPTVNSSSATKCTNSSVRKCK
ncbi:UNVERIFIED_CONTAM: hypothetical protein Sradi_1512200 [Sesamum radiatum]|uniref:Myb/SANT-like domain-containing protein n=1 Tax=Sesamum radiatum TaxID=300843 RepID=A0AAW2U830_SESRA